MADQTKAIATTDSQLLTAAQAIGVDLKAMLDLVPEAGEDAYLDLIRQIASATDLAGLDAPFSSNGLQQYLGQWLEVRGLKRLPSDFADGLGVYLILDAKVATSGEVVAISTGSVNVVVQLLRANALNALPVTVRPLEATKPSKNGYKPMHLEFYRLHPENAGD